MRLIVRCAIACFNERHLFRAELTQGLFATGEDGARIALASRWRLAGRRRQARSAIGTAMAPRIGHNYIEKVFQGAH